MSWWNSVNCIVLSFGAVSRCTPVPSVEHAVADSQLAIKDSAVHYTCVEGFMPADLSAMSTVCDGTEWTPSLSHCKGIGLWFRYKQVVPKVIWEQRVTVPIDYNRTLRIHHQNCPFRFDDHQPHLIHGTPTLGRPYSPSQTAYGSNQPFHPNTLSGRQTDRWDKQQSCTKSAYYINKY